MQFGLPDRYERWKFQILKIHDGGRRHLEKSKNLNISALVRAISTKFDTVMLFDPRSKNYA